ncbi:MAG: F0F1 ATP synthase subunit A [Ruminococcus sp.]|nr:F0F1 ATP synthase subunit A [Ruminococcus sp.]
MIDMGEKLVEELENRVVFTIPVDIPLVGPIVIHESIVVMWCLMAVIMIAVLLMTRKLSVVPGKMQALLEGAVQFAYNFLEGNMGKAGRRYVPYLGSVLLFLGLSNIIGLVGFGVKPPTKDINVTVAYALLSILLIEIAAFRGHGGVKGFFKSFLKPMPIMLPINIMEIVIRPLSLCMRLFGNVLGAFVVMKLIEHVCGLIVPMVFSMYFDVFDGLIQAYVFVFLTSLFIAESIEEENHKLEPA